MVVRVVGLHRHPVKSMGGESLAAAVVQADGIVGDRNWAVLDGGTRAIRSAKQWPALLTLSARYLDEPVPDAFDDAVRAVELLAPDGSSRTSHDADVDAWLGEHLGRSAHLAPRRPAEDLAHYALARPRDADDVARELDLVAGEPAPDYSTSASPLAALLQRFATPPGTYVDAHPIHLVSSQSLQTFRARSGLDASVARFRPNIVVDVAGAEDDPTPEQAWIGRRVRIGDVVLEIVSPTGRCAMPAHAQPRLGLVADRRITVSLVRELGRTLGVYARVVESGSIRLDDALEVAGAPAGGAAPR